MQERDQCGSVSDGRADASFIAYCILAGLKTRSDRAFSNGLPPAGARVPNTVRTRFGIASITKPMTEALVSVLLQPGRLDFDAPVERYLPGFPRGPKDGAQTVRELMNRRGRAASRDECG